MKKLGKILAGIALAAAVVAIGNVPAKAMSLEQIAEYTAKTAAWNQAEAARGMAMAEANQANVNAQAAAGLAGCQALLDQSRAACATAAADRDAKAAAGMAMAVANQANVNAQAAAGLAGCQALIDQSRATCVAAAADRDAKAAAGIAGLQALYAQALSYAK